MNDHDEETILQPRPDPSDDPACASAPTEAQDTRAGTNTPPATAPPANPVDSQRTPDQSPESSMQAQEQSAETLLPRFTAPGYKLLRALGRGTFGDVWLAEQEFAGAQPGQARILVAVKFFRGKDKPQLQRMVDEAKILARLRSDPRIVYLIDHDADALPPFFVMDYMERGSLAAQLADRVMPLEEALPLFRQIVEAMALVHAKGIRHCDLKPANILLNADGKPKIADFGQAHLSLEPTDMALGTFFYMAPDQANTEHQIPDSGWDVYGMGAVFFAMVTGTPPRYNRQFADELASTASITTKLQMYRQWVQRSAPPTEHRRIAGMDRTLADIVDRCIAVDPKKRLRDAGDVLAALEQRDRSRRQKPFLVLAGIVFLMLIAAMAGFGLYAVNLSQTDLENRVLDSDLITAHLVANVVRDNLKFESMRLEGLATSADLRADVLALADPNHGERAHDKLHKILENKVQHSRFNSLTIFDHHGALRLAALLKNADDRANPEYADCSELHGRYYTWRDYWNRRQDFVNRKLGPKGEEIEVFPYGPNIDKKTGKETPYIGQPFQSTARATYVGITISTPIMDPVHKKRIGLLIGSVRLKDLHTWIDPVEKTGGCAVLIDHHGYCVHHKEAFRLKQAEDKKLALEKRDFRLPRPGLQGYWRDGKANRHVDPYIKTVQLAVHVPIEEFGWHVIVQHDREEVLKEIETIRGNLRLTFLIGVAATALVLAGLWWGFLWFERRKERLAGV